MNECLCVLSFEHILQCLALARLWMPMDTDVQNLLDLHLNFIGSPFEQQKLEFDSYTQMLIYSNALGRVLVNMIENIPMEN